MVRIYVCTHKEYEFPKDPIYVPIQVGSAINPDLGYLPDNKGDNISARNPYYSELTGMYWAWKNDHDSDIKGLCHYRRYLMNDDDLLWSENDLSEVLLGSNEIDLITTKLIRLNYPYYDAFSVDHNKADLDALSEVLKQKYPEDHEEYERVVHDCRTYFGNMIICRSELFDAYSEWLFDILFEVEKRIDPSGYNGYAKRVYGFLSELLLLVYIRTRHLKVKECQVAMMGEKKETAEMKQRVSEFFCDKDVDGAKKYFLECLEKKPDVLMEASDIYGELKLCMQMISTAEYEIKATGNSFLGKNNNLDELIPVFRELNNIMQRRHSGISDKADEDYLAHHNFSDIAIDIAGRLV
ncbi:MAG: DUF4422 domain-containing protein [Butyrivibrio sp.]|nr:DUF4422 domain-containing protein [Butyrivibrio sp.]